MTKSLKNNGFWGKSGKAVMIAACIFGLMAFTDLPSDPRNITAGEFLANANRLKSKSVMALLDEDVGKMQKLGKIAGQRYRDMINRQKKNGQKPHSCPPPEGKAKVSSGEMLAYLESLPAAQKRQSFQSAVFSFMKKKYPC